jgi:tartrate dehydrogenase/decarboxylase/D-malate dehydrogenase
MLDHLGERQAAAAIVTAIETVLAQPALRTRDLGGPLSTEACGRAIADALI